MTALGWNEALGDLQWLWVYEFDTDLQRCLVAQWNEDPRWIDVEGVAVSPDLNMGDPVRRRTPSGDLVQYFRFDRNPPGKSINIDQLWKELRDLAVAPIPVCEDLLVIRMTDLWQALGRIGVSVTLDNGGAE